MSSETNQPQKKTIGIINIRTESDDEDEEIIKINLKSNSIYVNYIQLFKYSKLIRDEYTLNEAGNRLSSQLQDYEEQFGIQEISIIMFFKLIQKEDVEIDSSNYFDLFKLSSIFKSQKIKKVLKKTLEDNSENIEFVLKLIYDYKLNDNLTTIDIDDISFDFEQLLKKKVNECLQNKIFWNFDISMVYRIVKSGQKDAQTSNFLLDYIMANIEQRYVLFGFVEIKNLSDEKFDTLLSGYIESQNSEKIFYYEYLVLDLSYLQSLKEKNKNQEKEILSLNSEIQNLKDTVQVKINENKELKNKIFVPNISMPYITIIKDMIDKNMPFLCVACLLGNYEFVKQYISLSHADNALKTIYYFFFYKISISNNL